MDVTEFLRQLQPYFTPIGIAALVLVATMLRNMGRRLEQNTERGQQALEQSDVEIEREKLGVEREKFYLESTRDMFLRVKKLEDKDEANEKRIAELIERDQEHEDVLTLLRNQREIQDKELVRLNSVIEDLNSKIIQLQNENNELKLCVKNEQEARERAEKARDVAEKEHVIERNGLNAQIQTLRDELTQVQSRMGKTESLIQAQEDKGVPPQ